MFAAPDLAVVCCVALLSAAAGIWWINRAPKHGTAGHEGDETALLFDSGILQHGSETALASLSLQPGQHDWGDIRAALAPRFPGFPEMAGSGRSGSISLKANDKRAPSHLRIVWRDPLCWVTLSHSPDPHGGHQRFRKPQNLPHCAAPATAIPIRFGRSIGTAR
ncbi:hypothetical protein ACFSUD_16975 [Sulfitobacter aestuarii]|uniref:Uncharacterized protein n=1 Tax=Sulfitobacter aestuarii TaxID=2161676 RepID=A0ABW5U600_9RHOB